MTADLLFIIQRIYNSAPCRYPCRQCRTQQIDDHTENKCQQEYPRTKQCLHVQAELARRTHILIIGEQPRTHAVHAQLIAAWQSGEPWITSWVDRSANAIGLSLYNFLNILNINQIWLYGRSCAFGENWLNTIIRQTGFNPFDRDEGPSVKATQIGFGQLSRAQQVLGIGYLYVEAQLRQI